ncbi:MAG: AraC family transcriptional regulator [Lachnospiraceae bacterium]|nr:AraC family transcriptional regulator [Lachnospiraceae bacterium]
MEQQKKELEIVRHTQMNYLEIFLLEMSARQPHGHEDLEIGVILEGSLYLYLENEHYLLKPGDIYVINRYQVHALSASDTKCLILAFQIDTEFYRRINPALDRVQIESNIIHSGVLHDSMYERLLSCALCYFQRNDNYELRCAGILLDVLYQLLSSGHCHSTSEKEQMAAQSNSARLNRITDYISENYMKKISLQEIADRENITVCHASHFIRKMLGISFQEYLNNKRFEHAYRLIQNSDTDFNILDICLETGFSSSRYLNQMFEKKLGCSVKDYLKTEERPVLITPSLPADNSERKYTLVKAYETLDRLRRRE